MDTVKYIIATSSFKYGLNEQHSFNDKRLIYISFRYVRNNW